MEYLTRLLVDLWKMWIFRGIQGLLDRGLRRLQYNLRYEVVCLGPNE